MRSRGETQKRRCDCRGGGVTQGPTFSGVGVRMKTVWPSESGGMTQTVSTGTSGMGEKPQSMRAQGPPHPRERRTV